MSIVKQIVDLAGGTIDIRSELGKGTEIKLSLPLEDCPRELDELPERVDPTCTHEDAINAVRRRAHGRTVTIRGFDNALRKSDLQLAAVASLKASIEKYVTEWFNLTIVSNDQIADIVISDESAFLSSTKALGSSSRLLLILCSNGARRDIYMSQFGAGQLVEFVSKPCGPHRLAKALLNCLDTEDALEKSNADRVSQTELHSGAISPVISIEDAKVTAGTTSNLRLIGDLKSSIGFSPTAINLNISPALDAKAKDVVNRRPSLAHRTSSGAAARPNTSEILSSENATTSNGTSELSSTSVTANSSTSVVEEEASNAESVSETAPVSLISPKMLLVEVIAHKDTMMDSVQR